MAYRVFQFLRVLRFTVVYTILLYFVVLLQRELVRNAQEIPDTPLQYNLENILKSQVQPKDGQNIFFIETSRVKRKKERLFTARQACAVESAGELSLGMLPNDFNLFYCRFDKSTLEYFRAVRVARYR